MTPEIPEKIPIVKGLYANKSEILQAKTNPKTLNEAQNLTETNQDYYEIPPDEGYIRPYFDWDKKLDHEPNQDEIREEGQKAMEDLKALGFTGAYWATRHGLSASGRHKISYRAWIPKFKTTKSDLNRRVRNYIKANPLSSLDPGVYTDERKMGMVNCIKGDTEIYPKDPAYDKNSEKKRQFLPDTRILKLELEPLINETNKLKALKQTIISIVDEDAEIWELDEDEYQSIQAEPPSPRSTENENFTGDETFDPTDYKELYEKYYTNPIFYGTNGKHFFSCDEKGRDECWNCGQVHSSNNYTTWRDEAGNIHTKNLSKEKGCESRIINRLPEFAFELPEPEKEEEEDAEKEEEEDAEKEEEEDDSDYGKMKRYFEREKGVCMIEKGLTYIVEDEFFLNKKELTEHFQDLMITAKIGRKEREIPFTDLWFRDPKKAKKRMIEFAPNGAPDNVYNLWRGYKVATLPENSEPVDIEPFKKLLRAVTDSKEGEEGYEYLLKWIAFMFKHPEMKTRVAIVIRSNEGIGKNTLFWFVGDKLMSHELYNETNSPETDIFKDFTTFAEKKKLLILDEANCFKYHEKICPLITNEKTTIRRKYAHPNDINNFAQIAILTNNTMPVKISPSDRRYVVYDGNDSLKGDTEFFNNFYKKLAPDPRFQRAVYDYLMEQEVQDFNWADRPVSEAYKEIRMSSLPKEAKFLIHLITQAWPFQYGSKGKLGGLEARYLFALFESYCGQSNYNEKPNPSGFGSRLRNFLKKQSVYSEKDEERRAFHKELNTMGYTTWIIDREMAFNWLKKENFTTHENFEDLHPGIQYWGFPHKNTPEYKDGQYEANSCRFWAERIRHTF